MLAEESTAQTRAEYTVITDQESSITAPISPSKEIDISVLDN
jgi:hypothetical protein